MCKISAKGKDKKTNNKRYSQRTSQGDKQQRNISTKNENRKHVTCTYPTDPPPDPTRQLSWKWRWFKFSKTDRIKCAEAPFGVVFL